MTDEMIKSSNRSRHQVVSWDFRLSRKDEALDDNFEIRGSLVCLGDRKPQIVDAIRHSLKSMDYLEIINARKLDSPEQVAWNLDKRDLIFLVGERVDSTLFRLRSVLLSCFPRLLWTFILRGCDRKREEDAVPLDDTEIVTHLYGNNKDVMNIIAKLLRLDLQINAIMGYELNDFLHLFGGRITQIAWMKSSIKTCRDRYKQLISLHRQLLMDSEFIHWAIFYSNENDLALKDFTGLSDGIKKHCSKAVAFHNYVGLDPGQDSDVQMLLFTANGKLRDRQAKIKEMIVQCCQARILRKLRFSEFPKLSVNIRQLEGPDKRGRYILKPDLDISEPSEWLNEAGAFNMLVSQFRWTYIQLLKDTDKKTPLRSFLIEAIVSMGNVKISAGYNWLVMGMLKNGDRYCAILDVLVRPLFKSCGLMSLMKQAEMELAKREKCDFIQTWHASNNPDFNAAIIPSLKRGFILYHGNDKHIEDYETGAVFIFDIITEAREDEM